MKKIIYSNFILIICLFLIIYFSSSLIRDFLNKKNLIKEVTRLQNEINELTGKNSQLVDFITYLESSDYLEEEARLKLSMKKPEEKIIIINENFKDLTTTTIIDYQNFFKNETNPSEYSNFKKWWQYFFQKRIV